MSTYRTADGVEITEGLRVWDNNLERVVIALNASWEENGKLWFDTYDAAEPGRLRHLMSDDRVSTTHPRTGERA